MATYRLASIPLRSPGEVQGILEWERDEGFVVGLQTPTKEAGVTRLVERQLHPTSTAALRALADLIEAYEPR